MRTAKKKLPKIANYSAPAATYSLAELLESLWNQRHTGSVVLHFREGRPRAADVGRPIQIVLRDAAPP